MTEAYDVVQLHVTNSLTRQGDTLRIKLHNFERVLCRLDAQKLLHSIVSLVLAIARIDTSLAGVVSHVKPVPRPQRVAALPGKVSKMDVSNHFIQEIAVTEDRVQVRFTTRDSSIPLDLSSGDWERDL